MGYSIRVIALVVFVFGTVSCGGSPPASSLRPFVPFQLNDQGSSDRRKAPAAISQDLLYVTDLQEVRVFTYPRGRFERTLTGFYFAVGACVDQAGSVYIADYGYNRVVEYAHGGTKPVRILHPGVAHGCSVDPTSGNLAVANLSSTSRSGSVGLAIYKNAKGKPTYYSDPDFMSYQFCSYDNNGNLFVDGETQVGVNHVALAELPKGGNKLVTITLNKTLGFAGGVQWDGMHLAITDTNDNTVYRFAINGRHGTLAGDTPLEGTTFIKQPWIAGARIIVPNSKGAPSNVLIYKYPAGGSPIKSISKHLLQPQGATISKAPVR